VRGGPLWGNGGFSVILADEFADIFDGFGIGSNDLTQRRAPFSKNGMPR
jgi:hypothetical protein